MRLTTFCIICLLTILQLVFSEVILRTPVHVFVNVPVSVKLHVPMDVDNVDLFVGNDDNVESRILLAENLAIDTKLQQNLHLSPNGGFSKYIFYSDVPAFPTVVFTKPGSFDKLIIKKEGEVISTHPLPKAFSIIQPQVTLEVGDSAGHAAIPGTEEKYCFSLSNYITRFTTFMDYPVIKHSFSVSAAVITGKDLVTRKDGSVIGSLAIIDNEVVVRFKRSSAFVLVVDDYCFNAKVTSKAFNPFTILLSLPSVGLSINSPFVKQSTASSSTVTDPTKNNGIPIFFTAPPSLTTSFASSTSSASSASLPSFLSPDSPSVMLTPDHEAADSSILTSVSLSGHHALVTTINSRLQGSEGPQTIQVYPGYSDYAYGRIEFKFSFDQPTNDIQLQFQYQTGMIKELTNCFYMEQRKNSEYIEIEKPLGYVKKLNFPAGESSLSCFFQVKNPEDVNMAYTDIIYTRTRTEESENSHKTIISNATYSVYTGSSMFSIIQSVKHSMMVTPDVADSKAILSAYEKAISIILKDTVKMDNIKKDSFDMTTKSSSSCSVAMQVYGSKILKNLKELGYEATTSDLLSVSGEPRCNSECGFNCVLCNKNDVCKHSLDCDDDLVCNKGKCGSKSKGNDNTVYGIIGLIVILAIIIACSVFIYHKCCRKPKSQNYSFDDISFNTRSDNPYHNMS